MAAGRRRSILAVAVVVAVTMVGCSSHGTSRSRVPSTTRPTPARIVSITIPAPTDRVDAKWLAYPAPPRANVLLPAGYDPHRRYPLVVFLNGLGLNYSSYAKLGLTKPLETLDAIVVMPEGGNGWYTDWWNDGTRGSPAWESYELDTVIPTILARYPIRPERRDHALIGISMGGLGATYLGGRLPGFFGSVASLSGFVDPQWNAAVTQPAMATFSSAAQNGDRDPAPVYGPPDGFYATGHNPTRLVENLASTRLFVSTGTGVPSRSDPRPSAFEVTEEKIIDPMSENFDRALTAAGIDVTYQVHAGVHGVPDFLDEVHAMLEWGLFAPVAAQPAQWKNATVATSGQLWDFNYRFERAPTQVVEFEQSGTTLSVSAAGSAVAITAGSGCVIHTATPATVHLPDRRPISPREPGRVGRTPCT